MEHQAAEARRSPARHTWVVVVRRPREDSRRSTGEDKEQECSCGHQCVLDALPSIEPQASQRGGGGYVERRQHWQDEPQLHLPTP